MKLVDTWDNTLGAIEDHGSSIARLIPENDLDKLTLLTIVSHEVELAHRRYPEGYTVKERTDHSAGEAHFQVPPDEIFNDDGYLAGRLDLFLVPEETDFEWLKDQDTVRCRFSVWKQGERLEVLWELPASKYTIDRAQANFVSYPPVLSIFKTEVAHV